MPRVAQRSARTRALQQRARREAAATNDDNFTVAIARFETKMRNLEFVTCSSCLRSLERSAIARSRCLTCSRTEPSHLLYTTANSMDIGEVPPVLQGLTMVEQILIARVNPVVSVFRIRGQQRAYSGHVMNFLQNIGNIATRLPHDIGQLNAILVLNRNTPNGVAQFRVRSRKVRNALMWLKGNNFYYHDVILDERAMAALPEDGDVGPLLPNAQLQDEMVPNAEGPANVPNQVRENIIDQSCFPRIPMLNVDNIIDRNIRRRLEFNRPFEGEIDIGDWPEVSSDPLNEFTTEGIICQAFPALFPYGRGDLNAPRRHKISAHKYFKYLMSYYDGRFANDSRFPYYAYNTLARWDALNCGNVFIRQNEMQNKTVGEILEIARNSNSDLAANIMYYGQSLRGTRSYWRQRSNELLQMCRQLGTPTVFFTLSAADYHWPDLFRILRPRMDRDLQARFDSDTLSLNDRATIMHDNPATVAWFFETRCDVFLAEFMKKVFKIADYWYRFEWQHRGSPHIHGIMWLQDAPNVDDIDSLNDLERGAIVDYFDRLIAATLGERFVVALESHPCKKRYSDLAVAEKRTDLDRLLCGVQRHSRCGAHCIRRDRRSGRETCRYKFPMAIEPMSRLVKEDGHWKYIPRRNDDLLQRYNPSVTQAWRGNTDFSAIISRETVLQYIAKYASKGEQPSADFAQILRSLSTQTADEASAATLVRKLLIASVAERNYSAQEVMHLVMGWPLYHASRTFVILSLKDEYRRLGQFGENKYIVEYASRPDSVGRDYIINLSLYEFVKRYAIVSRQIRKRSKEVVVIVTPFVKLTGNTDDDELYYLLQCKQHYPWHGDFASIKRPDQTWREFFLENLAHLEDVRNPFDEDEIPPADDENIEDLPDRESQAVRTAAEALARLRSNENRRDPLGRRVLDEAEGWLDTNSAGLSQDLIADYLRRYKAEPPVERSTEVQVFPLNSLSPEQRQVIDICSSQIADPDCPIKRVVVQGKAGTGKSVVIREICRMLDGTLGSKSYQVLAPTGQAAVNVDGVTIHSFLRIPAQGRMEPLNGHGLRSLQLLFRDLKFIIIDEYSMIGKKLLEKIHVRLREGASCTAHPFGGLFLYLFGDLRQLPPVRDVPIYMPGRPEDGLGLAQRLIDSMQRWIILSIVQRQDRAETVFKDILDNLSNGTVTEQDWRILMDRRQVAVRNRNSFRDAVHLFPTNEQVRLHNEEFLAANGRPVAIIEAIHNCTTARQGSSSSAQGLEALLYLSIGCRVMLRRNLCVARGLVNGALGTVRSIVYLPENRPPALPHVVLVHFDKFTGPYLRNREFPILPVTSTWKDRGVECSRRQFPLSLAYALTIHKSQGLTLDRVAVELGDREVAPGASYVALSRARRLTDIMIASAVPFVRFDAIGRMGQIRQRIRFLSTVERNAQ